MEPVLPFSPQLGRAAGQLTQTLHRQLRSAIVDGRLAAGARLPSTRRLAAELGVGRNTVTSAYDLLVAEGYAIARPGARAVVADLATRRPARRARSPRAAVAAIEDTRLARLWRAPLLRPSPVRGLPERSFRLGMPEYRRFPHDVWRRLTAQSLRAWSRQPFAYPPSEGLPELREAIARHVAFTRAVACRGEDVIVTSGAQQAFDLLARVLVTPGRTRVAVEDPGYLPLQAAFVAAGAQLVPVEVDDDGLRVDRLPDDVQVVSVTPSHQSPTGVALSLRRRTALLAFARERNAVVIEDDYDGEFRFGGRPLDALQTLDRDARVFYVGTFTKSLFPSLRKGFVVAPEWAREALVAVKHCADAHSDTVTQAALAAFIRDGHLARHVRRMHTVYAARRQALLDGLRFELGDWLAPIPSEAGLHLAARVLRPERMAAVMQQARRHLPGVQAMGEYAISSRDMPALCFGYGVIDAADIRLALARFARALDASWDRVEEDSSKLGFGLSSRRKPEPRNR